MWDSSDKGRVVMLCLASFTVLSVWQAAGLSLILTIKMGPSLILFNTPMQTPFDYSFYAKGKRYTVFKGSE